MRNRHPFLSKTNVYSALTAVIALAAGLLASAGGIPAHADENLFGWVRGAETLPQGRGEIYQFITTRTGKVKGTYAATDFETELEYGITDQFQASVALENRYLYNKGVTDDREALDDTNHFTYGGFSLAGKYRILSPFKDGIGLAVRLEGGYLLHDEVDGLPEHEVFIAPEIDLQKNFRDDTIITQLWFGSEWAWGKQPAEEYPREISVQGGAGVSYRFAPNWYIGIEGHARAEYPMFDFNHFEHVVVFAGPSLHYGTEKWWANVSWGYQVYGNGIDEPRSGQTYAEEARNEFRFKVGFNF